MRALGFPGRATLTAWVWEAFPETKTVTVGARARGCARGTYSDAVKQAGVVGLYSRQETAQALAETFGVSRPTLYNWKNQLLGPEAPATLKRQKSASLDSELDALARRREALQCNIRELRIEHDRLKTARDVAKRDLGGDLQGPEAIVTGQSGKDHADRRPEKSV